MADRKTPNPDSEILAQAIIGGAGLGLPPNTEIPDGHAAVLLLVPDKFLRGKTIIDIQKDIGLPWSAGDGDSVWIDELQAQGLDAKL